MISHPLIWSNLNFCIVLIFIWSYSIKRCIQVRKMHDPFELQSTKKVCSSYKPQKELFYSLQRRPGWTTCKKVDLFDHRLERKLDYVTGYEDNLQKNAVQATVYKEQVVEPESKKKIFWVADYKEQLIEPQAIKKTYLSYRLQRSSMSYQLQKLFNPQRPNWATNYNEL